MSFTMQIQELTHGWSLKQTDTDEEWMPVAKVPTNVHLDLIDNDKIEDPFLGFNELKCEWVGKQSWTYKVSIPAMPRPPSGTKYVLAFDGLDTFATVWLGGEVILRSDNMWVMHRVDITNGLCPDRPTDLVIEFKSALIEAQKIKDAHPEHKWVGFNGDMARLAVRKAQYHWGWDWGPLLSPCGPWRPVRLETYQARISDLHVQYEINRSLTAVNGTITVKTEGKLAKSVLFEASYAGKLVFQGEASVDQEGTAKLDFYISEPKLWYPHGYGEQALYQVSATVIAENHKFHTLTKRTGFRKGELIQEPDDIGKTFYFRFNNIDVFCGGSDWIPADSFTTRISQEKYRKWLNMMVDGFQLMIRIWGGGIWEDDAFYETCDELGVLVWQDFMFGCGNYPCFPEMLESIEREAVCQLTRLRDHPCVAIFAGNNEDYQVQESFGLTYTYEDKDPQSWLTTDFPARYIYEKLLPDVVAAYAPHIPYHPGSPWGDGKVSSDPRVGDMHQWNVWHGTQEKYQIFDTLGGRFNSEFGMEAFPHIDTIRWFVTDTSQLYAQSHMIDFHNKADGHERRIATYVVENFRSETDLEKYIHLTQLSQAEAMSFGYKGWRKQWGQKRLCGGALLWQLNDCWPVTSWSIVDYFLRKKPAYYTVRRVLAPIAIAVRRAHHDWSVIHARPAKLLEYECWVSSSRTTVVTADIELRFISIKTGNDVAERVIHRDVKIVPNGTTEILAGTIDNEKEEAHVLAARIWCDGKLVHRDVDWPQPLKYLDFTDRQVQVTWTMNKNQVIVRAGKPTKGLVFEEREGVLVDDSAIDLVPGDEHVVTVQGLGLEDPPLRFTYLGAP